MSLNSLSAARSAGRKHRVLPSADAPALIVDVQTYDRLHALAQSCADMADVVEPLLHELDRAQLVPPASLPDDVVAVGSRVIYQDDTSGSIRTIDLVWPQQANIDAMRVSVLTPIGAALIGLRVGQRMRWQLGGNADRRLTVIGVSRLRPA